MALKDKPHLNVVFIGDVDAGKIIVIENLEKTEAEILKYLWHLDSIVHERRWTATYHL